MYSTENDLAQKTDIKKPRPRNFGGGVLERIIYELHFCNLLYNRVVACGDVYKIQSASLVAQVNFESNISTFVFE